jgi:large repetitive protein
VTVPPLAVLTTALPPATADVAYSAKLAATGGVGPYSWALASGTLPAGLILHAATGIISGTPKAGGTADITVQVTDSESPPVTALASESVSVSVAGLVITLQ